MAINTIVTPTWVTKDVARVLVNNLKFASNVTRTLDDEFVQGGAKVGFTVNARLPQRFTTAKGQALVQQAIQDNVVPITLTDQAHVGFGWSSASGTMEIQEIRNRYVNPAGSQLANTVDRDGLSRCYQDVYWQVGTPATVPQTSQVYLDSGVRLTNAGCPITPRTMVIGPQMMSTLVGTATLAANLFNPQAKVGQAYSAAMFAANWLGYDEWYQDQNVFTHTVGPLGGSPVVNGANQTGSSLITNGWTAAAANRLKKGDIFTLPSVFAVNPQSYGSVNQLQTFVVTADTNSDGSGNATIPISPAIITSGPFQTVTASPANGVSLTIIGAANATSPQGLGFHQDAFALVMADLMMPFTGKSERVRSKELGISVRYWQDSDIVSDQHPSRLDILYGWKTIRPELAVRVMS